MSATALPPSTATAPALSDDAAPVFEVLADPVRLEPPARLRLRGACGCAPGDGIRACGLGGAALSRPTVSRRVKALARAGLAIGAKEGRWMYYRTDPAGFGLARRIPTRSAE